MASSERRTLSVSSINYLPFTIVASLRGCAMGRKLVQKLAVAVAVIAAGALVATLRGGAALALGAEFAGPGPAVTGNDTGGIFPYSPDVEPIYHQIAGDYCARWGRYAKVTSIHRVYGEYVGFVWYDC